MDEHSDFEAAFRPGAKFIDSDGEVLNQQTRAPAMKETRGGARISDWIPADDRERLDLSELADLDDELDQTCRKLGDRLGAHVAAYRPGATARPTGLCSLFRYAVLTEVNARLLGDAERERRGIILVAYARPLQRW